MDSLDFNVATDIAQYSPFSKAAAAWEEAGQSHLNIAPQFFTHY